MSRFSSFMLLPLLLAPSVGRAQAPDSLPLGQRVRIVLRCELVASEHAVACRDDAPLPTYTGRLEAADQDNVHLRAESNHAEVVIPAATIASLSIVDGKTTHFWSGAGIGVLAGAIIGLVGGSATAKDDPWFGPGDRIAGLLAGLPAGFFIGGFIGALIPADRWRPIAINGHRIQVAPRLNAHGIGVAITF